MTEHELLVDRISKGEEQLLCIKDITKRLNISRSTFERMREKDFPSPCILLGKSQRWTITAFKKYLTSLT